MKNNSIVSILIVAVSFLTLAACSSQKTLTILHTNDTHSTIMPLSYNLDDTLKAGRGGFLRRIAMVQQERKEDSQLLLFDSGDFSQGSPYYTLFMGEVEVELMNRMGYDAVTIGNHEFDFGLDNMAKLFSKAQFPVVCSNLDFTGTPLEGIVKDYVVIKRKGLKIGVFGLSPKLEGLVLKQNCTNVKFLDPAETAKRITDKLKNDLKCDMVICLSHLGWNTKPSIEDRDMVSATKGLDLVLGGHTHTYMKKLEYLTDAEGKKVAVDQNGKHAIFVGKMKVVLTRNRK